MKKDILMKPLLFSFLFLFAANYSTAQAPVSDTSEIIIRGSFVYYIDGIMVRSSKEESVKSGMEDIEIITGGIPGIYGDICGPFSIIVPLKTTIPAPQKAPTTINDKLQNLETE